MAVGWDILSRMSVGCGVMAVGCGIMVLGWDTITWGQGDHTLQGWGQARGWEANAQGPSPSMSQRNTRPISLAELSPVCPRGLSSVSCPRCVPEG